MDIYDREMLLKLATDVKAYGRNSAAIPAKLMLAAEKIIDKHERELSIHRTIHQLEELKADPLGYGLSSKNTDNVLKAAKLITELTEKLKLYGICAYDAKMIKDAEVYVRYFGER